MRECPTRSSRRCSAACLCWRPTALAARGKCWMAAAAAGSFRRRTQRPWRARSKMRYKTLKPGSALFQRRASTSSRRIHRRPEWSGSKNYSPRLRGDTRRGENDCRRFTIVSDRNAPQTVLERKAMRIRYSAILAFGSLFAAYAAFAADVSPKAAPAGWITIAPRDEIKPTFRYEPDGGRD